MGRSVTLLAPLFPSFGSKRRSACRLLKIKREGRGRLKESQVAESVSSNRELPGTIKACFEWSRRRDLNPRPSDYKSDALPTELRRPSRKDGAGDGNRTRNQQRGRL